MLSNSGASAWIDHFVVGIDDLNKGIEAFEAQTGVRPAYGGEHPDLGTHNALVSLGPNRYLEILAPRPGATLSPLFGQAGDHDVLTPILWAAASDDLGAVHRSLAAAGFPAPAPISGSRTTAEGDVIRWSMFMLEDGPAGAPFFNEWHAATRHPSETTPAGCTLRSFEVVSEDATDLSRVLSTVGLDVTHGAGPTNLQIEIETPRGVVSFGRAAPSAP